MINLLCVALVNFVYDGLEHFIPTLLILEYGLCLRPVPLVVAPHSIPLLPFFLDLVLNFSDFPI